MGKSIWALAVLSATLVALSATAREKPIGYVAGGSGTVNGQKAQKLQAVYLSDNLQGPLVVKSIDGQVHTIKPKNPNAIDHVCDHVSQSAREHAASPSVPAQCP